MTLLRPEPSHPRRRATVRVRVKGGYQPSVVHARMGEPLRIVFSREETASCSEHVVFPAFGKSAMLPAFEDVALDLLPEQAGEYEFTCQLGMLRGLLVVAEGSAARPAFADDAPANGEERHRARTPPGEQRDTLLLGLGVWLCSLPLVLVLAVPFLGWQVGGLLALVGLGVVATVCIAVCARRVGLPGVPLLTRRADGSR